MSADTSSVCAETIYDGLYRRIVTPETAGCLRTRRTFRQRRRRTAGGRIKQDTAMRSIHQRPRASSRVAGHWEGDLIIKGQRSAVATLVERKARHDDREEPVSSAGWSAGS